MNNMNNTQGNQTTAPNLSSNIDVLAYIAALFRAKYFIIGSALLVGAAAVGYSYMQPDMYESFVKIDLVDIEDPGGVSPDNRRAAEVLTLVEHSFVLNSSKDNYLDVTLAKMRSRQFCLAFMEKHQIFKHFYAEHWSPERQIWLNGFQPDRGAAYLRLLQQVLFIGHNPKNDIISVRFRWTDPVLTRDWANAFVNDFNDYMRQSALEQVNKKRAFLEQELIKTRIVDIQQSIYRLIEAQTAVAMLASSREDYVLEVIDPAIMPLQQYSTSRKIYLIVGLFLGGFLAISTVIGRMIWLSAKQALMQYQLYLNASNSTQTNQAGSNRLSEQSNEHLSDAGESV